jgi:hypothetical protein
MNAAQRKSWSPYVVGAGIGVLSWFAFLTVNRPLGITGAFEHTAALAGKLFPGAADAPYYADPRHRPKIDWEWMLVVGVLAGSWISSTLSGDRQRVVVPELWTARFGAAPLPRLLAAFAGGVLMMFGARVALGCTSGHGISGALQLAVSSWVFTAVLFATGVPAAFLIYGSNRGARHG